MPIVIANCPDCGRSIEIDTAYAVVLSGTPETVWRIVKANYRVGDMIDRQIVADMALVSDVTVWRALKRLARYGLIERRQIRAGGTNHHYYVAYKHPEKITRALSPAA